MASSDDRPKHVTPIDFGDPLLPVAGHGSLARIRSSRRAPWRAAVLIGIHLAIAAHAAHFYFAGRTLSPVEPSESMYTLELGYVNAGFIFFAVALLVTLVFGRFFCGWGCHLVALQDACGWIMKKMGIRPRPFRSRLLLWIPLLVALYMFVWPSFKRLALVPLLENYWPAAAARLAPLAHFPGFSNDLLTDGFWETFPGPWFAFLTLATCGFAAVYFLGAKGFCTYGCPYGGFFVLLDRFSPSAIVVNDDCEGCGHCTATCTSNVLVHEEVRLFGKVVDPGCMKCMDCVDVCPKNALSFGWSKPSFWSRQLESAKRAVRFDLTLAEEAFLLAVFAVGVLAFRGLYDGPPLLMSLGLAGITAMSGLKLVHLARKSTVRLQNLDLKLGGRLKRAGWVFVVVTVAWLGFAAHSAVMQGHRYAGRAALDRTQATRADVFSGAFRNRWYPPEHHEATQSALRHFGSAARWGLVEVPEVELGLAWCSLLLDDAESAIAHLRGVLAKHPDNGRLREELFQVLMTHGFVEEAIEVKRERIARGESLPGELLEFATVLAQIERPLDAIALYREELARGPETLALHYNLGGLLRRAGEHEQAIVHLESARGLAPDDGDTWVELGLSYRALERWSDSIAAFERAIELDPAGLEATQLLPGLIEDSRSELLAR